MTSKQTMKVWICARYGGPNVLVQREVPIPVPRDNEVLIKIAATTVSAGDVRIRSFNLPRGFRLIGRLVLGISGPRQAVLGSDFAGSVAAIGRNVREYQVGDEVVGFAGAALQCHAEYRVFPVTRSIAPKPSNLSFAEAASLPFGAMTAWCFLGKAKVKAGEKVLVIGAAGAVGCAMVQLAHHLGAVVSAVTSGGNFKLVQSLGASALIDYQQQDFTKCADQYDVIIDTVGASSFAICYPLLHPNGRFVSVAGGLADALVRGKNSRRSIVGQASEHRADLLTLLKFANTGVLKPTIDRTYPFDALPEAHRYVETGRKKGSVVVEVP